MKQHRNILVMGLIAITLIFSLAACGGSDGSSGSDDIGAIIGDTNEDDGLDNGLNEGVFLDSVVEGISYKTETQAGITDSDGTFMYREGESVKFFIGDILLGETKAKAYVTPIDMVPGAINEMDEKVTVICMFLQSLDYDGNVENGIEITQEIQDVIRDGAMNGMAINFNQSVADFEKDPYVQGLFDVLNESSLFEGEETRTLCSAATAQAHMRKTLLSMNLCNREEWLIVFDNGEGTSKWTLMRQEDGSATVSGNFVFAYEGYDVTGTFADAPLTLSESAVSFTAEGIAQYNDPELPSPLNQSGFVLNIDGENYEIEFSNELWPRFFLGNYEGKRISGGGITGLDVIGGGDVDLTVKKGYFIDGPVEGLRYATATQSGTTDSDGTFTYLEGEVVKFFMGDILLGGGMAKEYMTPMDIVPGAADVTDETVTIICMLLQSLDYDGNVENGIEITQEIQAIIREAEGMVINFESVEDFENDPRVQGLFAALNEASLFEGDEVRTLCCSDAAQEHLRETLNSSIEKWVITFYNEMGDSTDWILTLTQKPDGSVTGDGTFFSIYKEEVVTHVIDGNAPVTISDSSTFATEGSSTYENNNLDFTLTIGESTYTMVLSKACWSSDPFTGACEKERISVMGDGITSETAE